jgi:hypothetical protein
MRNTSTELSFISQRQVVFRNPPAKKTAEEAVTKATGRWQWSELLNNRAVNSESKENDRPSTTANPRSRVTFALNLDNSKEEEGEEVEVFSQGLLEECTGDTPASPNALSKSQSVNPTTSDLSPNPVERPIEDSSLEPAPKLSAVTIESYTNNDSLDALDAGLNDDDW